MPLLSDPLACYKCCFISDLLPNTGNNNTNTLILRCKQELKHNEQEAFLNLSSFSHLLKMFKYLHPVLIIPVYPDTSQHLVRLTNLGGSFSGNVGGKCTIGCSVSS